MPKATAAKSPVKQTRIAYYTLDRATPGALKMNETDLSGAKVLNGDADNAATGGLYLRKAAFGENAKRVKATFEIIE